MPISAHPKFNKLTFHLTPVASATADTSARHITAERPFAGSSTFTRTVWLPRPIDSNNIVAKLNDGILHITIPKAEDKGSVKIRVD
jgi:HSP20 family molecular chaperone IbpA